MVKTLVHKLFDPKIQLINLITGYLPINFVFSAKSSTIIKEYVNDVK